MDLPTPISVKTVAEKIGAKLYGNADLMVKGLNEIHKVRPGDLTFVDHPKYYEKSLNSAATIIVIDKALEARGSSFRTPVLAVAVGIYLPLELTVPICIEDARIVGNPDAADTQALLNIVREGYRPFQVVALGAPKAQPPTVPLLQDRGLVDGQATAYVCQAFACQAPVTKPAKLQAQLAPR